MKLKYYLRGMGVGIILTAIIMGIALKGRKEQLSDAEIMARARELGMIDATVLSDYAAQDGFGDALGGLGENGNAADGSAGESVRSVSQSSSSENPRVVFEPVDPMQDASAVNGSGSVTTGGDGGTASTGASFSAASSSSSAGKSAYDAASASLSSAMVSSGVSSSVSKTSSEGSSISSVVSAGSSVAASSNAMTAASLNTSAAASDTGSSLNASRAASTSASTAVSSASSVASAASAASSDSSAASTVVNATAKTDDAASSAYASTQTAAAPAAAGGQTGSETAQDASVSGKSIVIPGGVGSETVAAILEREGLIDSASAFDKYLCDNRMDRVLRSGTKTIPEGADWDQIAAILTR